MLAVIMLLSCPVYGKKAPAQIDKDLKVFETSLATSLKKNVSNAAIKKIKDERLRTLATALKAGTYQTEYRVAEYKAFLSPTMLGKQLRIGNGYSNYENITGIYLSKGKHLVMVENIAEGKNVELLLPNWNRRAPEGIETTKDPNGWGIIKKTFPLKNGINEIDVTDWDGLVYIHYYSDQPKNEKPIKVHFVNGQVNGYFDIRKNNNEDWKKLIDNAVYPVLDARGRHIQIAYPVEALKKYAYERGTDLISNYDSLVYRQHRFIGLVKYKRVPENHILARVNYNYYMFRNGDGVAYMGTQPGYAMRMVAHPDKVISGDPCWGFSHEVGHVHQLSPYLNWGGLGEVSNNIVTLYVTTSFGNKSRISAQKNYEKARKSIIDNKISYLQDEDVFNRLVPFWQLQLYFAGAGKQPDFYADLYEAFRRQTDEGGRGHRQKVAEYQLNFVKQACKVSKTDLTEFFDKWGFFHIGKFEMNDYGKYTYEMTPEMVAACKAEVKAMNLPKPIVDMTMLED
ncbi:MAG: M60 family metallopeptidase [Paludibacter sp.]|nr:M60 family metallopeptidase [Paludibacter sp.]